MAPIIEELHAAVQMSNEGQGGLLQQKQAQATLSSFKEDPDAWLLVDRLLQDATDSHTKYLGVQVLDDVVMTRWKVLPKEQCQRIQISVVTLIIQFSGSDELLKTQRALLNKLNLVLVSILKQEWPHNWPNFINEIISSCHTSSSVCENNMSILRLLSEEVLSYTKIKGLKTKMCAEFLSIFQYCSEVLSSANQLSLITATLEALHCFFKWIPLGYIFETPIIDTLCEKYLEMPEVRNVTLKCLTEIGGLQTGQQDAYNENMIQMFKEVLTTVSKVTPLSLDLRSTYEPGNSKDQDFLKKLALFLCNFLSVHLKLIENPPNRDVLTQAHFYLIRISQSEDGEIFKVCLKYWTKLVQELCAEMYSFPITDVNRLINMGVDSLFSPGALSPNLLVNYSLRKHKYHEVLSHLRVVMIEKMVRPGEVMIEEDGEGEIVRGFVKESETSQLYKTIRECLVYLTHLDVVDTENIMTSKIARQVDGSEWSWANCNSLCWAIGSISLAMNEETERRFLVTVIIELVRLAGMKRGKDNKAVVATNVMYILGQHPRFLKAHWELLKTVINKLFEFMHEAHKGVQEMACDTFIKIARQCKRHCVALQPGETEPFIEEIVRTMRKITCDLTPQQVHKFYEACGYMIAAQPQKDAQERLYAELMSYPNAAWKAVILQVTINPSILQDAETVKVIENVMKTNVSSCTSIGSYTKPQIGRIYPDMLAMYLQTSQTISEVVARDGDTATKTPQVRGLRTIKKAILKLVETYVVKADDLEMVRTNIVPAFLDAVLFDYNGNVPDARDAEVLRVMSAIITKLSALIEDQVPNILENVFECTLEMINKDFSKFSEHSIGLFSVLRAINLQCFPALVKLDNRRFRLVIDSCMWASKHDNREVEYCGLNICLELITNIAETDAGISNAFFQQFFVPILQGVFFVLIDTDHKAGFESQSTLLCRMFYLVHPAVGTAPKIKGPIYNADQAPAGTSNREFLADFVVNISQNAFPNLELNQIKAFVEGLFTLNNAIDRFKLNLRDFLDQAQRVCRRQCRAVCG